MVLMTSIWNNICKHRKWKLIVCQFHQYKFLPHDKLTSVLDRKPEPEPGYPPVTRSTWAFVLSHVEYICVHSLTTIWCFPMIVLLVQNLKCFAVVRKSNIIILVTLISRHGKSIDDHDDYDSFLMLITMAPSTNQHHHQDWRSSNMIANPPHLLIGCPLVNTTGVISSALAHRG